MEINNLSALAAHWDKCECCITPPCMFNFDPAVEHRLTVSVKIINDCMYAVLHVYVLST